MKPVYYAKNISGGTFQDISTLFNGVQTLKMDGFLAKGKPVNIYTAQWVNSQQEDFLITTVREVNNVEVPVVIRENVDIEITFIVRKKYATFLTPEAAAAWDCQSVHDAFVAYMTDGDIWIKSGYMGNKQAHCVCLKEYKPTTVKLHRNDDKSYILGTITLHTLDTPTT